MAKIQELLTRSAGTEGSLLIEKKIYGKLIEAVEKKRIGRDLAALYNGPTDIPGSSIDIDFEDKDSMAVAKVAEGAAVPIDVQSYTSINLRPVKYGVRPLITKEMMEDGKWNLMMRNVAAAGKKMAENEDTLIVAALDTASNTVSGGAAITIANITRAIQYLEDEDFEATDLIIGPEVANDLRNIGLLVKANESGSTEMLKKGYMGVLFNMNVHVVSGNIMTSTNAYVIDRNEAFTIAEKRPVTVEEYDDKTHDLSGAVVTQRVVVSALKSDAICKITTS